MHDGFWTGALPDGFSTSIQILASGYLARHPALLGVLEWLGWNNPGGSINP